MAYFEENPRFFVKKVIFDHNEILLGKKVILGQIGSFLTGFGVNPFHFQEKIETLARQFEHLKYDILVKPPCTNQNSFNRDHPPPKTIKT